MSRYYKRVGEKINSYPILAQAKDSISDVYVTSVVLISIFVKNISGYSIDGFIGVVVSCFILYQGYELTRDTISEIIGTIEPKDIEKVREEVLKHEEILSVHDIVVVDFGPQREYAWMDVELDENMSLNEAHAIIDGIERQIYTKLGYKTSIHLDPVGSYSIEEEQIVKTLNEIIKKDKRLLSFHDLFVEKEGLSVDIAIDGHLVKTHREEIEIKNYLKDLLCKGGECSINLDRIFKEED